MPEASLRAVNGIGARARVPAGHTLLVPAQRPSRDAAETLTSAVFTTVPQGRTIYHRVSRGDTLTGIAARYSVTTADLKLWNNLAHESVRVGQQLRITSDRAAGPRRARSASSKAAKGGGTKRKAASAGGGSSAANGSPKKPVSAAKR